MPHQFIKLGDDILTLDDAQEIDDAVDAIKRLGLQSIEVYAGGPDEERSTDLILTSAGIVQAHECDHCPAIGGCPDDPNISNDDYVVARFDLQSVLRTLLDPDSDDDMRAESLEEITALGRVEVSTFEDAGVLTRNQGLVLTAGSAQFQITIVRSR